MWMSNEKYSTRGGWKAERLKQKRKKGVARISQILNKEEGFKWLNMFTKKG